jgi:replicative DNA helicase
MPLDLAPSNADAERFILATVLLDESFWPDVAAVLKPGDFSTETHQRIFRRMGDLYDRGEHIDRVPLYLELEKHGEAEACGGMSYLASLTDGLPLIPKLDAYIRIVQELSIRRRAILMLHHGINRLAMTSEGSAETLVDTERMLAALGGERDQHGQWQTPADVMAAHPGGLQGLLCPPRGGDGVPTPWPAITESLSGLHAGELVIVAGRPGMGKSIVGMHLCHYAASKGHGAAAFSLEMTNDALVTRLIASIARVDAQKMRAGYLNAEERRRVFKAAAEIENRPLWMDDTRARTVPAMTGRLRRLASQNKIPKLIMIDHVQLMVGMNRKNQDRRLEIEDISNSCKHMAREFKATVILLSQLNRACEIENRRPQLSDLRESGSLEQDADVVLFVHRPEAYAKNHDREDLRGLAEFIIAKQRSGPTGKRDMIFLAAQQRFESRAEDREGLEELD